MTSAGSRSGVNCSRRKSRPERLREAARGQRLAQAGQVLQQHVAAGQDAGEHQLQRVALAHHHGADRVEHRAGQPAHLVGAGDLGRH